MDPDGVRRYYERRGDAVRGDRDFLSSTIERRDWVARFRTAAEQRHLARIIALTPGMNVLDLGGGSGRYALLFARRCRRVVLVDFAEALLRAARQHAADAGLTNLETRHDSVLSFDTEERFDLVFVGGVLTYLEDEDLRPLAVRVNRWTKPGAHLLLREPVSPAGRTTYVDPDDPDYRSLFRTPDEYPALFAEGFRLVHQRKTLSHLIPRVLGRESVECVERVDRSGLLRLAARVWLPLQARFDYRLLRVEESLRRSRVGARLLADPGIVQHFYLFERKRDGS